MICSLFQYIQSRSGWGCLGGGGFAMSSGIKTEQHIRAPRPHHLEPWIASLELHYSGAAPISPAPNHSWSTE